MKQSKNFWFDLIQTINSLDVNEQFTRNELRKKFISRSEITLDCYRNYLTQAKFIKWIRPGVYQKIKNIPSDISEKSVKKIAYPNYNFDEADKLRRKYK